MDVFPWVDVYRRNAKAYLYVSRFLFYYLHPFLSFLLSPPSPPLLLPPLFLQVSGKAIPIGPYEPRTAGKAVSNAEQSLHALEKLGLDVSIEDTARKQK